MLVEVAEGSEVIGMGQFVLPFYILEHVVHDHLIVVFLCDHIAADKVVQKLVRVSLLPFVDLQVMFG